MTRRASRVQNADTDPELEGETGSDEGSEDAETEATDTITPKEMAARLGTDPKTFRRFLRGLTNDRAGKGGRWKLDPETCEDLAKRWADRSNKGTQPKMKAATAPEPDAE